MDATQAKVMTFVMPVFFGAVMLAYPLGLNLYIFTNNVLTVAQQYGLRRFLEKKSAVGRPALERRK
jgi:YidC/Oxa1 family membrane protein insertase